MELYFLDTDFSLIFGPFEEFTSLVWSERYFEAGRFTLHIPRRYAASVSAAAYVRSGFDSVGKCRCGRIGYISADEDGGCEIGGVMLEGILADSLMYSKNTLSASEGRITEVLLGAIENNLASAPIVIDAENSIEIEGTGTFSWEWENVSEWLYGVLKPYGASYRVELGEDNVMRLTIVSGADRSEDGGEGVQRAIFSASYGNIFSLEYERDTERMKNVVYVEGGDGVVVCLDKSGATAGDTSNIREIYKSASDLTLEKFANAALYEAALLHRGEEVLAKYPVLLSLSAEADAEAVPKYGEGYSLGDICDVADSELGLSCAMRLTAADIVCEGGVERVYPIFGEILSLSDRLKG